MCRWWSESAQIRDAPEGREKVALNLPRSNEAYACVPAASGPSVHLFYLTHKGGDIVDRGILVPIADLIEELLLQFVGNADIVYYLMIFIKIGALFGAILTAVPLLVYAERKISAFMQTRLGPNRVGPFGILQSFADMLKLMSKEDIIPAHVDRLLWALSPMLLFVPAALVYAVFPFDAGAVFADLNIGLFFVIAISAQSVLPFLMGGFASQNKYSLIGSMRIVAQMLSYEIPMVFALLGVVMLTGSLKMSAIVEAQSDIWFICLQPLAFVVFVVCATAETNRTPFDLVEGESEIIAGPFTEYSGMRWALFFLAEYANLLAASILATTLFLGGWHGPVLPGIVWFWLKVGAMIFLFMWFRWTFPRFRVDQMLSLGWKLLLPAALCNVLLTGVGFYAYKWIAFGG